jgi:hypothetical protein
MARHSIDRLVASQLLEAVRTALAHLSTLKIQTSEQSRGQPRDLMRTYQGVRRLRDVVGRVAGSYADRVDLELADDDANLLCSCILRELGSIDERLASTSLRPAEETWALEKREHMLHWGQRFATRPILELPRRAGERSASMRDLMQVVQSKFADLAPSKLFMAGGHKSKKPSGLLSTGAITPFDVDPSDVMEPKPFDAAAAADLDSIVGEPPEQADWSEVVHPREPRPFRPDELTDESDLPADAVSGAPPPPTGISPQSLGAEVSPQTRSTLPSVRPDELQDARLRCMLEIDLRAYERAFGAKDYRLAAVHLASILEAVVLDEILPRASELGMTGAPETWRLAAMLNRVVDHISPKDRAHLSLMSRCLQMLQPTRQLRSPVVVTRPMLEQACGFVAGIFATMRDETPADRG